MAQKFTVPVTIKNLSSAGSDGITVFLDQESFARLKVEAGGRITWGAGAAVGDTNLYRDEANVLKTDDTFKSAGLFVAGTQIDPSAATVGDALVFNGTKFVSASVSAGGGASLTVSDTAPVSPSLGDLWFNSSNARTYVYYDSSWVDVGSSGGVANIDDIGNVSASTPSNGDVLQWNGAAWVNVSASTVGATNLDGLSDVVVTSPAEFQSLTYNGTNWVNSFAPTVTYVRNAESTTLTTGTVVYLFGATGDHATVKRADKASDTTSSKTIGLVGASIAASQNGPVITRGYVDGIDLSVGYSPGDILWLNSNGTFTKTKAVAPDHLVFVGVVVRATNNGIVYVATQNGYELDELHNVNATSPSPGDFLKYNGSLWVNDQIDLGTDTTGLYVADLIAGTGVTISNGSNESASPTISIGQSVATNASVAFGQVTTTGNVVIGGNLTVLGTTTSINTETLTIDDNIIVLNNNEAGTPSQNAGIEVERGTSANVAVRWNETTDKWETTNDGTTYGNIVTTADSGTVTSTMIADGTIVNADINNSAAIALSKLASGTSGQLVIANASGIPTYTTLSGDITVSNTGVVAIAADSVALGTDTTGNYVQSLVAGTGITLTNATASEGGTPTIAVTSNTYQPFDADLTAIAGLAGTSGVLKKIAADTWALDTSTFVTTADTGSVTSAMIANGTIVDADINSSAAIALSKLSTTGASVGNVITYNGSIWTSASVSSGGSTVTASTTPPSSPVTGSIWFDSNTAKTYVYYDSFWVEIGGTSGGAKMYVDPSAPTSPLEGQLWFKSDTAQTFAYYDSFWVEIGAAGMAAIAADSAPASPVTGQIWFNSNSGATYVYYDSYWIEVGAVAANTVFNLVDAKGDLLVGTADNVLARQAVGTNGQLLQANSATTSGLQWFTPTYAPSASPTFTGTVVLPSTTSIGTVDSTEISYLDGVTSAIQTQLNTKASTGKAIAMAIVFGG